MNNASVQESPNLRIKEIWLVSNLLSLFRIFIIPVLWYLLSQPDSINSYFALVVLVLAGISDGLDGYIARKLNQVSKMGMILDPLADKILAGALVILLIFYRDFPIWLAAIILGRDLLILLASAILLTGKSVVVPSTITGKYAFFFVVVLLACSVIRFELGISITTYICLALIALSLVIYTLTFLKIAGGEVVASFQDNALLKITRIAVTAAVMIFLLIKLYFSWE